MGPKTPVTEKDLFRHPLREQINLKHPLVRLCHVREERRQCWQGRSVAQKAIDGVWVSSVKRCHAANRKASCWR
ncbi:hypothetical protein GCT19_42320 [Paraburkholderia sp. CNPSo 3155]|nr:hypothetical protein [Paraburkholderia atlantica]